MGRKNGSVLPHKHGHPHVDISAEVEPLARIDIVEDIFGWSLVTVTLTGQTSRGRGEQGGHCYQIQPEHDHDHRAVK